MEEPELNPGGEPPEDDRNDEVDGSPVPDPTEDARETHRPRHPVAGLRWVRAPARGPTANR